MAKATGVTRRFRSLPASGCSSVPPTGPDVPGPPVVTVGALVDGFPGGAILLFDHDLRCLKAGGREFGAGGWSGQPLEGRTIFEVLPAEMAARIEPSFRLALAGVDSMMDTRHRDLVFELRVAPVWDGDQVIAGIVHSQDVTERRQREAELQALSAELAAANGALRDAASGAEANESRYRALVDHLPDTVAYIWDRRHRISVARGAGVAGRGFDGDNLVGATPEEVMAPADAAMVRGYLDAAFEGRAVSTEAYFVTTGIENLIDAVPLAAGPSGRIDEVLLVARDIGRLKDRERALSDAEGRWRAAFEAAPVGMVELDLDGRILRANRGLAEILDRPDESLTGRIFFDFLHPDERSAARAGANTATTGGLNRAERSLLTPTGEQRWVGIWATRLTGTGSTPDRLLVHVLDISEQRRQQARLAALNARFSALVEHSSDAITVTDIDGRLVYASPAYATLIGSETAGWVGRNAEELIHPDDRASMERSIGTLMTDGDVTTYECRIRHATAGWRHIEVTASNWLGDPAVSGIVANARDVTERVEAAAHLAHQAMHDMLTDLPNRALLLDRLDQALARADRSRCPSALLFVDLDRFKQINDSLGHAAGDLVLTTVAERLTRVIRPGDSVARLGGDEFVVLAEDIGDPSIAEEIAERIRASVAAPIVLAERAVSIGCSIGIAISDRHNPETLLQEADMALYQAKGAGRNRWELYDQAMRTHAQRRLEIEQLVRTAITGEQLEVHYQPVVELRTGVIIGTEALVRIRGLDRRLVLPDEFIAVAEDCGLIVGLGNAVLRQACEQQVRWRAERTGLNHVAVNVSARQLSDNNFANCVAAVLADTGLPAEMLCLELTETALIDAGNSSRNQIASVKALGVTLALDDFGTGWSSLAYLRQFPFDIVKIDRSFVAGLGNDADDTEVVKAIIGLGQALGLRTVAEGVETDQQAIVLRQLGCDHCQGYLYGRPEPAERVPTGAVRAAAESPQEATRSE
jgi:diguanylate cyclase (GGDEF)-like protein/PAS domain S-box-containing protein